MSTINNPVVKIVTRKKDGSIKKTEMISEIKIDLVYQKALHLLNNEIDKLAKKNELAPSDVKNFKEYMSLVLKAKNEEREDTKLLLKELDKDE